MVVSSSTVCLASALFSNEQRLIEQCLSTIDDTFHWIFLHPSHGSTGTGTGTIWSQKKVPVSVPEKFGTGTGTFPGICYRYRKIPRNFPLFGFVRVSVPEKNGPKNSTGTGSRKIWSWKESTGNGTGKKSGHRHTLVRTQTGASLLLRKLQID